MKRSISLALVLAVMLCMLPAQTAQAATRYYLEVSITEQNDPYYSVSGRSGYLSRSESLTAELVGIVNDNYDESCKASGTGLYGFGSQAMNSLVYAGLSAYKNGTLDSWASSHTVAQNAAAEAIDLVAKLRDVTTPVSALTVGTSYVLTYTPTVTSASDPAHGNLYTLTITLRSSTSASTGDTHYDVTVSGGMTEPDVPATPTEPRVDVTVDRGGSTVTVSKAQKNETVTVTVEPDEGYVVSRVIVTDKNGQRVESKYQGNGSYSFTMPASEVTVQPVTRRETTSPETTGVSAVLKTDAHEPFMIGTDTGDFEPKSPVTRAQTAQIFYRLLQSTETEKTVRFDDVDASAWYATAVNTLAALSVLKGTGEGSFEPTRAITRAEFAAICARFSNGAAGTVRFADVPTDHWAYDDIATAAAYGWIVGDDRGNFNPDAEITRTEAAAIVNRMLDRLGDFNAIDGGAGMRFPDVSESYWGFYDITEASSEHLHALDSERLHEQWEA